MTIAKNVSDLLDRIKEKNDRFQELSESGSPYIGIFYVIGKELYWEGDHMSEVKAINGIRDYPREHSKYWNLSIQRILPEMKKYDYQYYPRGRVIYNDETKKFEVYCDKCIKSDPNMQREINGEMNIPYTTVYYTDGAHYKCHNCK